MLEEMLEEMYFDPDTNEFHVVMRYDDSEVVVSYTWREYVSHTWECIKGLFKAVFLKIRIYF